MFISFRKIATFELLLLFFLGGGGAGGGEVGDGKI